MTVAAGVFAPALAELLDITLHNLLTQPAEWARLGFIARTGKGTYALDTPPPAWP